MPSISGNEASTKSNINRIMEEVVGTDYYNNIRVGVPNIQTNFAILKLHVHHNTELSAEDVHTLKQEYKTE